MKINKIILLFIALFAILSCNKVENKSARESVGLKGAVKNVLSINYEAIDKFGEGDIITKKPFPYGSSLIVYDSSGNIINERDFVFRKINLSSEITHNDKGLISEYISYDNNENILSHKLYEYNDKGDITKVNYVNDGVTLYTDIRYNEYGQKIYFKKDDCTSTYKYDGNKLVEMSEKYGWYYNYVTTYIYDKANNLIEERIQKNDKIENSQETEYIFYKYDDLGRNIDFIIANCEDYDDNDIFKRTKIYYNNDSTTKPSLMQYYDADGKLKEENYYVYFITGCDTIAEILLNKDKDIAYITRFTKKRGNNHRISYNIKSDAIVTSYNYIDGKLISKLDSEGNTTTYEYKKDKLIKVVEEFGSKEHNEKSITLYKNGKIISTTSYDKDNKILWKKSYSYDGNAENGTKNTTLQSNDQKEGTKYIYKAGKEVQKISTSNGVAVTCNSTYDEQGNIIETKSTDGNYSKYIYEYDSYGNWIKRISHINGNILYITERIIEYF